MKVVVALDSFKGSLSSKEAGEAVKRGLLRMYPGTEVELFEVADGGEGTSSVLLAAAGGKVVECAAVNSIGEPVSAQYSIINSHIPTAAIDLAAADGLTLISDFKRDVMKSSTRGTGMLVKDALRRGIRRFFIGVGGSATCDAGLGMLSELGFLFLDEYGNRVEAIPALLHKIQKIDSSDVSDEVKAAQITLLCDVTNPLSGKQGAAEIFAPQKGATPEMVVALDNGLVSFGRILESYCGRQIIDRKSSGAGGGIGASLVACLNAEMVEGANFILDFIDIDQSIRESELVITGEGRMDEQTLCGKLPFRILERCLDLNVPLIGLAGAVSEPWELLDSGFAAVCSIQQSAIDLRDAMLKDVAERGLSVTAASALKLFRTASRR